MVAQRKYPEELRERAVKMVLEVREREGKGHGELARVGRQLGVHPEALRSWMKQTEIDSGERPGTTTGDRQRISELEREVRELRRANEILKAASAYFARELAPGPVRRRAVCAVLGFPVPSYYYARKRAAEPAARDTRDAMLKEKIMQVWKGEEGREVYGARKIWLELNT